MNEILVMKESQHPNIVNVLEFHLVKSNELWGLGGNGVYGGWCVEGNNTLNEDQISGICLKVCTFRLWWTMF